MTILNLFFWSSEDIIIIIRRSGESSSKIEKIFETGRVDPKEVEIQDVQKEEVQYCLLLPRSLSNLKKEI